MASTIRGKDVTVNTHCHVTRDFRTIDLSETDTENWAATLLTHYLYTAQLVLTRPFKSSNHQTTLELNLPLNGTVTNVPFASLCYVLDKTPGVRGVSSSLHSRPQDILVSVDKPTFRALGWEHTIKVGHDVAKRLNSNIILQVPLFACRANPLDPAAAPSRAASVFHPERLTDLSPVTIYGTSEALRLPSTEKLLKEKLDVSVKPVAPRTAIYESGIVVSHGLPAPPGQDVFSSDYTNVPNFSFDKLHGLDLDQEVAAEVSEFLGKIATLSPVTAMDYDFLFGDSTLKHLETQVFPSDFIIHPDETKRILNGFVNQDFAEGDWLAISFNAKLASTGLPGLSDSHAVTVLIYSFRGSKRILIYRSWFH